MKKYLTPLIIVIILVILYLISRPTQVTTLNPSWNYDQNTLSQRLKAAKLPELQKEGEALHTHQHLDISVNGQKIDIPTDIGIAADSSFISPLHTHDTTGIIHVESPTVEKFFLGQFFDVWGIKFDQNCISGYCRSGENLFEVYVDGKLHNGNPREIELLPRQEIFVFVGSRDHRPSTIPSTYNFPEGY